MSLSLRRHIHKLNNDIDYLTVEINDLVMDNFELTNRLNREIVKHNKATLIIQNLQVELKDCYYLMQKQTQEINRLRYELDFANRLSLDYCEMLNNTKLY